MQIVVQNKINNYHASIKQKQKYTVEINSYR